MDSKLLYYDNIAQFHENFFKDVLTQEHLVPGQIKIDKLHYPDGGVDDAANFWGYVLEKDDVKYLVSSYDENQEEININDILPFVANDCQKVADKTTVYYHVRRPVTVKFKPEKTMEFRQFVDTLSSFSHSNPKHYKLFWFLALASMYDRANFRISTCAGFGKDSTVDILGNLVGGCATVENPTIAKLEFMTSYSWLAVNEVVDISKAQWLDIEQFLLSTGAHKPAVTKRSRSGKTGVKEVMNLSKFSISLLFNDIDHYPDPSKYFDSVTKQAVKDRFPSLRLHGVFTEDFNQINKTNIKKFVADNVDKYKELIYNYTYYEKTLNEAVLSYDTHRLIKVPSRWATNLGRLLKIVGLYVSSQEEFNEWVVTINNCILDYKEMVKYPKIHERLIKKLGDEVAEKEMEEVCKKDTFKEKNITMNRLISGEKVYTDNQKIWDEII